MDGQRDHVRAITPDIEHSGDRISLTFADWQIPLVFNEVARQRVGFAAGHQMVNCVQLPDGSVRLDYDPA